jgi:hypothetical protein
MQPSNVFHAPRFGAYFKKHIVDNYRLYLMSLIVLCGLILTVMLFAVFTSGERPYTDGNPFYLVLLFIAGLIFTGFSFNQFSDKPKGVDYLLLPASHFEKFLTTWLITTVGFILVYNLAFYVSVLIASGLFSLREGKVDSYDWLHPFKKEFIVAFEAWFLAQAVIMLGSIYFTKFSLIKTLFFLILFVVLMGLVNMTMTNILFGNRLAHWASAIPFYGVQVAENGSKPFINSRLLELPPFLLQTYDFVWRFLLAPVIWTLVYFRLKDKEI